MSKLICKKCNKPLKENTDGNLKSCQEYWKLMDKYYAQNKYWYEG